jgi:hypothetical protein
LQKTIGQGYYLSLKMVAAASHYQQLITKNPNITQLFGIFL